MIAKTPDISVLPNADSAGNAKRIVIVVSGKSPTAVPGGLGAYAYNACRIFDELGYRVFLLGYGTQESTHSRDYATQITVPSSLTKFSSLAAPLICRKLANSALRIIKETAASEVIIFGAGIWAGVGLRLKQIINHPDLRITVVGAYFTTFTHEYFGQVAGASRADYGVLTNALVRLSYAGAKLLSFYEHKVLTGLDHLVIHYEASRKILTAELPSLQPEKLTKIPYYVDFFERSGSPISLARDDNGGQIHITIICRQDPRKGINTFLRAIKILVDENFRDFNCTIAGSGVFLNRHIKLSKFLGLESLVKFAGFVPSSEELILNSDIVVLPSFEEGAGAISLLEAMKIGRPIISSDCDGIPEDLTHEESALLFEPGDIDNLKNHIRRLCLEPELRDHLANNAKMRYHKKFSFQKMKGGIEKLLETET